MLNSDQANIDCGKRRLPRHRISVAVEVYDASSNVYLGRLVNIHQQGLMLMGRELLSIDKIYQLELRLPKAVNNIDVIHFAIDCLWVRDAGDDAPHWSGCRIIDVCDETLQLIEELVEHWGE